MVAAPEGLPRAFVFKANPRFRRNTSPRFPSMGCGMRFNKLGGEMTHVFKVGDNVLIDGNRYGSKLPARLAEVARVTATQFVAGGRRFKIVTGTDYGFEIGAINYGGTAFAATPERIAENNRRIQCREAERVIETICLKLGRARDDEAVRLLNLLPEEIRKMGGAQ